MSTTTLHRFMEQLVSDASFRESVQADPEGAFAAFGFSPSQQEALMSGDMDALRRMSGADVAGFIIGSSGASFTSRCTTPRPADTPGSGNHCGTGNGGGDYYNFRPVV
jgi:hypothetical protein